MPLLHSISEPNYKDLQPLKLDNATNINQKKEEKFSTFSNSIFNITHNVNKFLIRNEVLTEVDPMINFWW